MTTAVDTLALHTSYLTLDARHRIVRDALVDAHLMHRLIMSGWREDLFPGEERPRANVGILYALAPGTDNRVRVVVQANTPPNWAFDEGVVLGGVDHRTRHAPLTGDISFQLIAAPRKSSGDRVRTDSGSLSRGKTFPLPAAEREDWGRRTLTRAGVEVIDITVRPGGRLQSAKKSLQHNTVIYSGTARITDADAHRAALVEGVGPAKAYGCGLLLTRATSV